MKRLRLDHRLGLILHRNLARPFFRRPRLVIVLGTMRSGSTVLSNVLISNSEIAGFGESHLVYDEPEQLLDLRYWVFRYTHRYPKQNTYLFDKILHTPYTPDLPRMLVSCEPRVIFMLRSPAPTARSIYNMIAARRPHKLAEINVWTLLADRYEDLRRLAAEVPGGVPVAAISYDAMIEDPEVVLDRLSKFLDLTTPLSANYEVPRWGGRWGLGDGSQKMQTGQIDARPRPPPEPAPDPAASSFEGLCKAVRGRADLFID